MMHNSVYPVYKEFFGQLPKPLYHNLLHAIIWCKNIAAEGFLLVVQKRENCMVLSPGCMQDVQPLPNRWHSACPELCNNSWHWCVVTWFEVHKQGSPTVNTVIITLPVDTCDKILLSGCSGMSLLLACWFSDGFKMPQKCITLIWYCFRCYNNMDMSLGVRKHGTHLVISKALDNYMHRNSIDREGMLCLSSHTVFTMQCSLDKL